MAKSTAEGVISPLDMRLRPDGEKGTLTCSLSKCEAYYYTRAQLWELQALTRARPLCGILGPEYLQRAQLAWRSAGEREDLFAQIDAMRGRIRCERGSGSEILDFKTGLGGMVEAEFLVQALQMRAATWSPQFNAALDELKRLQALTADETTALAASYDFLRRCESILRRWENTSVSSLPPEESEQRKLAKRAGAKDLAAFGDQYRAARETIHAIYSRYLQKLT
jgi:glutamate-ammonia-ligase adenylyltransferase